MASRLTNLEEVNGNLKITLTNEGKQYLQESDEDDVDLLYNLLEYHICNGWDCLKPQEIADLTSCDLIISNEVDRDEDGEIVSVGSIYWHQNYMVEDPVHELKTIGELILIGAN